IFFYFLFFLFFFYDTVTIEIYTLSLHDALPISHELRTVLIQSGIIDLLSSSYTACCTESYSITQRRWQHIMGRPENSGHCPKDKIGRAHVELQSRRDLVCRLLLEKKKKKKKNKK